MRLVALISTAVCIALCGVNNAGGAIPQSERDALIVLYNSTDGDDWTNNTGWLGAPGTECSWYGVSCDQAGSHVVRIDLESNNLAGELPAELSDLTHLQKLVLSREYPGPPNRLTGTIPPELGNLAELVTLSLRENQLTGTIPPELGNFGNLHTLAVSDNQLTGSIPPELGTLGTLNTLALAENQLTGGIPRELGSLPVLQYLELGRNQLSGTIPLELCNLSSLQRLALESNELSGSIPSGLEGLRELRHLFLALNQLGGTVPPELGSITTLEYLWLDANQLIGTIPPQLANLDSLRYLYLAVNQLTGTIPPGLGSLTNLKHINLNVNQLTGSIPTELQNLSSLTGLFMAWNQLTGTVPPWLGGLSNLTGIQLNQNQLIGSIPPELAALSSLISLELPENQLTGTIPPELGNLTNLYELRLHDNQLSGTIPPTLGNLGDLELLWLSSNQLSGTIPSALGNLSVLEHLFLSSNQLGGEIPDQLMNLSALLSIPLSYNGLYTDNDVLRDFIRDRRGGNFHLTQTIAPESVTARPQDPGSILVTWNPVSFTRGQGVCRVCWAGSGTGPFDSCSETPDKTVSWLTVDGLSPQQTYYFQVQTVTYPHADNQNTVVSEPSSVVSATTAPAGVAGSVQLAFRSFSASEGEQKDITVRRLGGATGEVSVQYSTAPGTASDGSDYIPNSGTLTWSGGDGEPKTFQVFVVDDSQPEGDETVTVTISNPTGGATLGSPTSAVLTIADSDFRSEDEGDTNSAGRNADVATDPHGNRVVVWSEEGGDDDGTAVVAQRYHPTGATIGSRILVNVTTVGDQHSPSVAMDGGGRFVVVWEHDIDAKGMTRQAGNGILGRYFDPSGLPLTDEIVIDDGSLGEASEPAVTIEPLSGRVVVVWRRASSGKTATDGAGIFGRYFTPTGQPAGDVITVDDGAAGEPGSPDVAVNDDGDVVVAWELVGPDGWSDVYALKLDGVGKVLGPEILVNEDLWRNQQSPAVVVDADGGFLVLWQGPSLPDEQGEREIGADVFGRYFSPGGEPESEPFMVNDTELDSQTSPVLAANTNGDCWAAWNDEGVSGGGGIFGRLLRGCSEPDPSNGSIRLDDPAADPALRTPSVAVADDGAVTVVYTRDDVVEGDGSVVGRALGQPAPGACLPDQTTLCLNESRFEIRVDWRDFEDSTGDGQAIPLTSDTGYFWFFDSSNVELVVKVLDGTAINGFYWVFYGALSNVEYTITITDTETGNTASYFNPLGTFASAGVTDALPGDRRTQSPSQLEVAGGSVVSSRGGFARRGPLSLRTREPLQAVVADCSSGAEQLCLNQERFSVRVSWQDFQGTTGTGQAVSLTSDTGYFWFFDDSNVELIIKVLDGRGINQHFWVFYGALSNVEYTITVTDTETGAVKTYTNPLGDFGSVGDTEAFFVP